MIEDTQIAECLGCGCFFRTYSQVMDSGCIRWTMHCGDSNCIPIAHGFSKSEVISNWNERNQEVTV